MIRLILFLTLSLLVSPFAFTENNEVTCKKSDNFLLTIYENNHEKIKCLLSLDKSFLHVKRLAYSKEELKALQEGSLEKEFALTFNEIIIKARTTVKTNKQIWVGPTYLASALENYPILKTLLKNGADPNEMSGPRKEGPLAVVSRKPNFLGKASFVKLLLSYGAQPEHSVYLKTPIDFLIREKSFISLLTAAYYSVNLYNERSQENFYHRALDHWTPEDIITFFDLVKTLESLDENFHFNPDIYQANSFNETALMKAATNVDALNFFRSALGHEFDFKLPVQIFPSGKVKTLIEEIVERRNFNVIKAVVENEWYPQILNVRVHYHKQTITTQAIYRNHIGLLTVLKKHPDFYTSVHESGEDKVKGCDWVHLNIPAKAMKRYEKNFKQPHPLDGFCEQKMK